jgi:O-methyltransferase
LNALYTKVVRGGFIYVDDYGAFNGCNRAVEEFRRAKGITEPFVKVYEDASNTTFEAIWWQKR